MPAGAQWTRTTTWRQGHVLTSEAVQSLGLLNAADPERTCVVVISHDCDLANDNLEAEPMVEVVVGRVVESANGNFTWGKAPRTLHYPATHGGTPVFIELVSPQKRAIPKSELARYLPDPAFAIDGKTIAVLRGWLGARYNRAAFPDAFVDRMRQTKADERLARALAPYGQLVSFVYFDLDEGQNLERAEGDAYQLSIVLVYVSGNDPDASAEVADEAASTVEEAVRFRLKDAATIQLTRCFAISEDDITVSQARVLTQWRLEYMTHRSDEAEPNSPNL